MSKKILAIASGGGHWTQMMTIREAFRGYDVTFVGVKAMYREDVPGHRFYAIPDVSRLHKWSLPLALTKLLLILLKEWPAIVVTTGSGPGMLALRLAKLLGSRTVWIDSVANVEEMSLSGQKARRYADLWLTQWPHLSTQDGPRYLGSII